MNCVQSGDQCRSAYRYALLIMSIMLITSCKTFLPNPIHLIVQTYSDEQYWLVKNVVLSAGTLTRPKKDFDHTIQDAVVLTFVPTQEPNKYESKTVWKDPSNVKFRTIRQTHDVQVEAKKAEFREPKGTPRVHSMPTKVLYDHKPGLWTVELYLDNRLARRLTFTVR
jgi:hypothetical protein